MDRGQGNQCKEHDVHPVHPLDPSVAERRHAKMQVIDLNADVGELVGSEHTDAALLDHVSSASVACGFHAGDPQTMHRTVAAAVARGIVIGAHPSYADRDGFGRRDVEISSDRLVDDLLYQIGALDAVARRCQTRVRYVKPHGALYNRASVDEEQARAVAEAVRAYGGLVLLLQAGTGAMKIAEALGVEVFGEVFADRAYAPDGTLVPRHVSGSVFTNRPQIADQAVSLATRRRVRAIDGRWLSVPAASICLHGDAADAAETARLVRITLEEAGVSIAPFAAS
jgi:UPF0271 protein